MPSDPKYVEWLEYIVNKFRGATMVEQPSPYFYLNDVFPTDLFELINRFWPEQKCFLGQSEIAESVLGHKEANYRKVVLIEDAPYTTAETGGERFWHSFGRLMVDPMFQRVLIEKAIPYLNSIRTDLRPPIKVVGDTLLQIDTDGFKLGPHLDSSRKLVSLIFYLPPDASKSEMGTSMFVPTAKMARSLPELGRKFYEDYYEFSDFSERFRAPFLPNSVFGFVVTPIAFHGVQEIRDAGGWRRNILVNLYHRYQAPYRSAITRKLIPNVARLAQPVASL